MLIDKGLTSGDVVTLKLTSGEEIITKLNSEQETFIKVTRPFVLTGTDKGIGMAPYLFTVDPDREIKIYRSTIAVLEPTEEGTAKQYIKTTTGIVT